jgi:hypothetical protein
MAGAGYKLFATGDVLTAAQVNTFLMEQAVMRFADSAARTTALSGVLAEGMVSYLQDTNSLEVYDGSAWIGATGDITALTAGTGISITNPTGPIPTVAIDTAVTVDLNTAQTLTNKTLTTPVISSISNTGTLTLPTSTDTIVGRATTDTLTNKTLTTPIISSISNTGTLTLPTSTDTLVGRATTDTLTNKTLTAPVISTISNTGTLTLPTSTDTIVGRATADTLTNKVLLSPEERTTVTATAATGTIAYDAVTQGVLYYTSNATGNWTLNIRGDSSTTLSSILAVGDAITVTHLVTNGATPYYNNVLQIDGSTVTPKFQGGTAYTAGNASSIDAYVYTVVKTAATPTYTVFASQTKFA